MSDSDDEREVEMELEEEEPVHILTGEDWFVTFPLFWWCVVIDVL